MFQVQFLRSIPDVFKAQLQITATVAFSAERDGRTHTHTHTYRKFWFAKDSQLHLANSIQQYRRNSRA